MTPFEWYDSLKDAHPCIVCGDETRRPELHHMERFRKCGCVITFLRMGQFQEAMVEILKCAPLCHEHHADLHREERRGNVPAVYRMENYSLEIGHFHHDAISTAPAVMFAQVPPKCYKGGSKVSKLSNAIPRI